MDKIKKQFFITDDGSSSIFLPELNEQYHSQHGAINESTHVYINKGLKKIDTKNISIFEVGFGTGLNALLTLIENQKLNKSIVYDTIELYPLSIEDVERLNYNQLISSDYKTIFYDMHKVEHNKEYKCSEKFIFKKIIQNIINFEFDKKYDLIYFDAFAPNIQPELWETNIFEKIFNSCNANAILTTYCAKGEVRRRLQKCGFSVERIDGPKGKREMIRATKII